MEDTNEVTNDSNSEQVENKPEPDSKVPDNNKIVKEKIQMRERAQKAEALANELAKKYEETYNNYDLANRELTVFKKAKEIKESLEEGYSFDEDKFVNLALRLSKDSPAIDSLINDIKDTFIAKRNSETVNPVKAQPVNTIPVKGKEVVAIEPYLNKNMSFSEFRKISKDNPELAEQILKIKKGEF